MVVEQGWAFEGQPLSLEQPGGVVTLVEGATFCLSGRAGDIRPGGADGLFVLDTRVLSEWDLEISGRRLEPLSISITEPYSATFVSRVPAAPGLESTVLVVRKRSVGSGLREELELHNYDSVPVTLEVRLRVASDFADLFAVKAGRVQPVAVRRHAGVLHSSALRAGVRRDVNIVECGAGHGSADDDVLTWTVVIPGKGTWTTCLEVTTAVDGQAVALKHCCGQPDQLSEPSLRLAEWRRHSPVLRAADPRLVVAVARAVDDVGSLIIEDPAHPESPVVAAGAPWFMALFGRDSLLVSYMTLLVDPALAIGVLQTLARLQGKRVDPLTEEQPGRILHEVRFSSRPAVGFDDGYVYYGTVDATPLFVVLAGELSRWGVAREVVDALLPHVDRALEWVERYGDADGDGYVEYQRTTVGGLANQGWKDSWDGVNFAGGELAEPPIALAEVQGYVYAAYLARAELADERADSEGAAHYRAKAARLKSAFNRDFWLPEQGFFAIALDREKRPVDSLASNMGHCLWSGIVDDDYAAQVAARLMSDEMFSGWGIRTLATSMARYNPLSYHNGSVWPHDSALAAAGLMRYGFVDESCQLIDAILDAATTNAGRLPELFAGVTRESLPVPVAYPTSCSPQAWSAAAPLLMLRTLLRLEPRLDSGRLAVDPVRVGARVADVELTLAAGRARVRTTSRGESRVSGLSAGVALAAGPLPPAHGRGSPPG